MSSASLEWALGVFLAGVGALMLVAPHQFNAPEYDVLRPVLPWWGTAFCAAGSGLLAAPALALGRPLRLLAGALAAAALLALAASFAASGLWGRPVVYAVVGLGALAGGWVGTARLDAEGTRRLRGDLLSLVMGCAAVLQGILLLMLPVAFQALADSTLRPYAAHFGVSFLLTGAALAAAQLRATSGRVGWALRALAHAAAAAVLIAWAVLLMLPNRAWISLALYAGVGAVVGLLPWQGRRTAGEWTSASLRSRLALALAGATALPLIVAATLIARQEEEGALAEALTRQQTLAGVLAQDTAQYVGLHRSAVTALAEQLAALSPDPAAQAQLLRGVGEAYAGFSIVSAFDAVGSHVAQGKGLPPASGEAPAGILEAVRSTGRPAMDVVNRVELSPNGPVFVLAAPVVRAGRFDGMVLAAVESRRISDVLAAPRVGPAGETYLVDAAGRAIAHPDLALAAALADFSRLPPVEAALQARETEDEPVSMRYRGWGGERLAGYARVPTLGWAVVVEQPISVVLGDSYARRDLIFQLLLLAIAASAAAGMLTAGRLTRSLTALARAADALAAEDTRAPLPHSTAAELARLATAFGAMRERLVARTAEREEAIRMRDNVLGTVSHDLKNPLTTIALRAHVLQEEAGELLQESEARESAAGPMRQGHASDTTDRLAAIADGLGRIVGTTHKMQSMIDDLVDTARLNSGQPLDLQPRPVDLVALAAHLAEEYRQTAERHRVVFQADADELVGEWDLARLERVLHNLIGNAVKYSPTGGTITIRVGSERGAWAVVSVTDQGMGIPAADLPKLFQRFYRATNVTGRIRGTGLGLYSARQVILQHGGTLEVESREGLGSTFTVRLPLAESEPADLAAQAPASAVDPAPAEELTPVSRRDPAPA